MRHRLLACVFSISTALAAAPAIAATGDPVAFGGGASFDPILDMRLRWESVDQDNVAREADAVTIRMRAGGEIKLNGLSFLAEAEGTLGILNDYNDTLPGNGIEPFPAVADPQNVELNRLQVGYRNKDFAVTLGRQRIILDNARFVGNVGWRQNEQTFDAVRGEAKVGPVALDGTYAISQRTVFGIDSPNERFDGDMFLLNGGIDVKPVKLKAFAYLVDYDDRIAFSSQTYGVLASADVLLGALKLGLNASYARQDDYKKNPVDYSADYIAASIGAGIAGFTVTAGYEELGSDDGVAAFQTPLATLHAFNGWADLFLTTPAAGLRDTYAGLAKGVTIKALPGLNAAVFYHKFKSDVGGLDYGEEWDAQVGFTLGEVGLLAKYARYDAEDFSVDTEKFWLQAEYKF